MLQIRVILLCALSVWALGCHERPEPIGAAASGVVKIVTPRPIAAPVAAPESPEKKEATQQRIRAVAASAHPVKIYVHSEAGKDDGSFGWVVGPYFGPTHYLGSIPAEAFHELLNCAEAPDSPYNDCFVHIEATCEEGAELSLSLYMDMRDPEPLISMPYFHVTAPGLWAQLTQLLNEKYDLPARARRSYGAQ